MPPAICNGCGNESIAWDKLCDNCAKEVTCQNCQCKYKRGQGLQEVDMCPTCLNDAFTSPPQDQYYEDGTVIPDDYWDNNCDYPWETYNGK